MVIETQEIPQQKRQRVLIVDDEMMNRELLAHMLEDEYDVMTAMNGEIALDILNGEEIDLVLLDVMMPKVTGLDVLASLRIDPRTKDLPVILISAKAENEDIVHGLHMGANDYITKPVDMNIVMARVGTQLFVKELTDERKKTIDDLQVAEKIRSQLFRIVSHDLKTPLNNIRMAEHLLREHLGKTSDYAVILDTISVTVEGMQNIIENFMDMVELQTGRIEVKVKGVDVKNAIRNVVTQYEVAAQKKDIQIQVKEIEGMVWADGARLVQVLGNLVSNALKYSPKQRIVTIWVENVEENLRIYVGDQGPGIPENERHLMFREFGRLSTRPTDGESSTGMGLWIVQHLMSLQEGTIGADFPADGGSNFWVSLPICDVDEVMSEE